MQHKSNLVRMAVAVALICAVLMPLGGPVHAQDEPMPIVLDEAGFGVAQVDALAAQGQAAFTLDLLAGDRVTMDLQGETDFVQVVEFAAPYGPLVMAGVPESFNYLAWAPEDGVYSITVANSGDSAAGFVLRVVVTPAPLPAKKMLTADANGQTIPVVLDEPFQVVLDVNTGDGYAWTLDPIDASVVAEAAAPATVPLGTMPGAMSQQIFTLQGVAPGATTLTFTNARAGGATVAETYSVTVEVMAEGEAPQAEPLPLDASGAAQATGTLDPQGMAAYVAELAAGATVRVDVTPQEPTQSANSFVLTVVGADGYPLQTDHAGASTFEQTLPVSQAYTFKVINFGDTAQAYTLDLAVRAAEPAPASARVPLADALGTLEPAAVWQHFYDLTQVPRPSHHEEQATAFVAAYGESLGLETLVDAAGNVIIRKPATPGLEDRPGVILQAHLDMVPQKRADSTHDFLTDPIDAYVEDGWVHADGTTLGADDGSGVAIIMALLADDALVHPPLEALFTTNEEDGFSGINSLAPAVLQGHYYINIDNEVEGQFLISSAGGVYADVAAAYDQETTPDGMTGLLVTVDGLRGGHSGGDIDKGRGSAHQLMARLLWNAPAQLGVRLSSLAGGNQANAIPRTTAATVAAPAEQVDAFTAYVTEFAATVQHELAATEPNLTVTVEPAALPAQVMAAGAQQALIGAVYGAPQGIIRMSDSVPGLVETSGNIGVLAMGDGQLVATVYVRSAVDSARDDAAARFRSVFELGGATVTLRDAYSGWPPNPDSPLLALMTRTYQDLFGVAPAAVAIHAGLETSVAGVIYPGLDMISIGPTILDVHSPDERWEVASAPKVYELLVATLAALEAQP